MEVRRDYTLARRRCEWRREHTHALGRRPRVPGCEGHHAAADCGGPLALDLRRKCSVLGGSCRAVQGSVEDAREVYRASSEVG